MKKLFLSLVLPVAMMFSCSNKNEYTVSGVVNDASEETMMLQRSLSGRWFNIDSVKTDAKGNFSFSKEAPEYPEIFRLERKGKHIYFPIDSVDVLNLTTDTAGFGYNYTLTGTHNAVWMAKVDSISRNIAANIDNEPLVIAEKAGLVNQILENPTSVVAYYIINKSVAGKPLFSLDNKQDVKIIGAVANAYNTFIPNDPRTELLKQTFMSARKMTASASADTLYVDVDHSQLVEIELFDNNGKITKLSEVASKGNVVLLNFTTYLAQESPALNAKLAELYKRYKSAGFEIYQVGYDDIEFNWKESAQNLPWITVFDPAGVNSPNLIRYNIGTLPALFIINRKGELSERILSLQDLDKIVAKYM